MAIVTPIQAAKAKRIKAPAFDYEPYYTPLPLTPSAHPRDARPETALDQMFGYWAG